MMRASRIWPTVALAPALALAIAVSAPRTASAAVPGNMSAEVVNDMLEAMGRAQMSVVGVRTEATEGARSADTLGERRAGSGVVIGPNGLILTIGYLMLEAQQIDIVTPDSKTWPATAVAYDNATGFGLIRPILPLPDLVPVALGSMESLKPGEPLLAATGATIGGEDGGMSMAELVSLRPFSGTWEYHIDAALYTSPPLVTGRGNHSGAPLFNIKGELLGIGSLLVLDASGENRRMPGNMFVPVDLLKPVLAEMQASGSTAQSHRPWLGLTSSDQRGRVEILRVAEDSPAEDAGLSPGQVVEAVDGVEVRTLESFYKTLWARATPEAPVRLTLRQLGDNVVNVELKPRDRMQTFKKPSSI